MNKNESKYFNTAVKMDEALIALIEKKDFEYITVKEVCAEAGVNRSTFYLHYENTRDLLDESVALMQKRFLSYFEQDAAEVIGKIRTCPIDELILITPEYLKPYLTYINENRRVYGAAMARPETFDSDGAYRAMFLNIFNPILKRFKVPVDEREYIMTFYLHGIAAVVSDWLKSGCSDSIDRLVSVITRCIPSYKSKT